MRIAVNTGGGDAPGLNAVIRAIVLSAENLGWEVYGIRRGYEGILAGREDGVVRLTRESVRGITHLGGTILGTTNRGNPFAWTAAGTAAGTATGTATGAGSDGAASAIDRSDEVLAALSDRGIDALIAIGGDGSLHIAQELAAKGLNVIGVPKTIDNDLAATQVTFGFHTAVQTASEAIDKLHSTAEAHRRVMVVELMGRHTGWIALFAGLSGTADVILIPEIPYALERVCEKIEARYRSGHEFAIVVAAEGACEVGGEPIYQAAGRYGGVGEKLADDIGRVTGRETRSLVLGHLQRGGQPIPYDRLLALRFGAAAVQLAQERRFGSMVALDPPRMLAVPLEEAVREIKRVPVDGDVVRTGRLLGVSFGD